MTYSYTEFKDLVGKTFDKVFMTSGIDGDEVHFVSETESYKLYHFQDCCESVTLEEIIGDLSDLEGSPIILAEERTEDQNDDYVITMWTFYELATIKGCDSSLVWFFKWLLQCCRFV